MKSNHLKVCRNHLSELFNAMEQGNIQLIKELEHELTPQEECVACAYGLKASLQGKNELENFLKKEGFTVDIKVQSSFISQVFYWMFRAVLFFALFAGILIAERMLTNVFFHSKTYSLFSLNMVEFVSATFFSFFAFTLLDDTLFD